MFENKKIYIMGMARSGYEAAKLLSQYHNEIVVTDGAKQEASLVEELEALGVKVIITTKEEQEQYLDDSFDYVIKNPGIRYDTPVIEKATKLGIKVINEVELAYHFLPGNVKIIAVTGANGKTTATTLIYEMLKQAGLSVHLGGNIGFPMCSLISKVKPKDVIVLEVSAQQLHDMYDFKADISVLTNLTPVHLDFFGDYPTYIQHKLKIFQNQTNQEFAILNLDNEDSMQAAQSILSKKLKFSCQKKADAYVEDGKIYYQDEVIMDTADIKLRGNHNYQNSMCAILAVKQLGVSNEAIQNVLKTFSGVEHRLEFVDIINGRSFYNDSKATNVKSTSIALSSFNQPTILLLGGLDRGHSFEELKKDMKHVKQVICYGETKNRILDFCNAIQINCTVVSTLEEATRKAYDVSEEGDVILLSPACASWDQYKCFEDRGNDFKRVISSLK